MRCPGLAATFLCGWLRSLPRSGCTPEPRVSRVSRRHPGYTTCPVRIGRVQDNDTHRRSPSPKPPADGLAGVMRHVSRSRFLFFSELDIDRPRAVTPHRRRRPPKGERAEDEERCRSKGPKESGDESPHSKGVGYKRFFGTFAVWRGLLVWRTPVRSLLGCRRRLALHGNAPDG